MYILLKYGNKFFLSSLGFLYLPLLFDKKLNQNFCLLEEEERMDDNTRLDNFLLWVERKE